MGVCVGIGVGVRVVVVVVVSVVACCLVGFVVHRRDGR